MRLKTNFRTAPAMFFTRNASKNVSPGPTYIDISDGLTGPDGAIKSSLYRDGLHPTGEGYRIIGANLGRLVTL